MRWLRFNYDGWDLAQFSRWSEDMFRIGMSVSAWKGDYGKATCLNCRAIVNIGVPAVTGLHHGKQHREVCGDRNLGDTVRQQLPERLASIGDYRQEQT